MIPNQATQKNTCTSKNLTILRENKKKHWNKHWTQLFKTTILNEVSKKKNSQLDRSASKEIDLFSYKETRYQHCSQNLFSERDWKTDNIRDGLREKKLNSWSF